MNELKPCPFCGSKNVSMYTYSGVMEYYYIECKDCYCGTGHEELEEYAVEAWNRRVENEKL